jgi:hypothetical protein
LATRPSEVRVLSGGIGPGGHTFTGEMLEISTEGDGIELNRGGRC